MRITVDLTSVKELQVINPHKLNSLKIMSITPVPRLFIAVPEVEEEEQLLLRQPSYTTAIEVYMFLCKETDLIFW